MLMKTLFSSIFTGFQGSDDLLLQEMFDNKKVFDFPKIKEMIKK